MKNKKAFKTYDHYPTDDELKKPVGFCKRPSFTYMNGYGYIEAKPRIAGHLFGSILISFFLLLMLIPILGEFKFYLAELSLILGAVLNLFQSINVVIKRIKHGKYFVYDDEDEILELPRYDRKFHKDKICGLHLHEFRKTIPFLSFLPFLNTSHRELSVVIKEYKGN